MKNSIKIDLLLSISGLALMTIGMVEYHPGIYFVGFSFFFSGFPMSEIIKYIKYGKYRKGE